VSTGNASCRVEQTGTTQLVVPEIAAWNELKDPDAIETRDRARRSVLLAAVAVVGSTTVTEEGSMGKSFHLNLQVMDFPASVISRLLELLFIHALAVGGNMEPLRNSSKAVSHVDPAALST
jgi:hypothetical protein